MILPTLVSYKHNVATKHGRSKPLIDRELWLLELGIRSTRLLASYQVGYVKWSIYTLHKQDYYSSAKVVFKLK